MTNEEKELLLKDLCARLPYGVTVKVFYKDIDIVPENSDDETDCESDDVDLNVEEHDAIMSFIKGTFIWKIKPYLRPMSSMTEEERCIYEQRLHDVGRSIDVIDADDVVKHIDWLNAHHFDYRGLIEKGLALEAPKEMYNP